MLIHSRRPESCAETGPEDFPGGGHHSGVCCAFFSPVSPEPGRVIRNMLGWTQEEKTNKSGVWLFRGALKGENIFSSLFAAGN